MDRETLDTIVAMILTGLLELSEELLRLREVDEVSIEDIENAFDQVSREMTG